MTAIHIGTRGYDHDSWQGAFYDPDLPHEWRFDYYCNQGLVELEPLDDISDINELQQMINNHLTYTKSRLAEDILVNWDLYVSKFVKVIPLEYKKVLQEIKLENIRKKLEMTEDTPQYQY